MSANDVIHMVRPPTPTDALGAYAAPLSLWHSGVAVIDPELTTEAVGVLEDLQSMQQLGRVFLELKAQWSTAPLASKPNSPRP